MDGTESAGSEREPNHGLNITASWLPSPHLWKLSFSGGEGRPRRVTGWRESCYRVFTCWCCGRCLEEELFYENSPDGD